MWVAGEGVGGGEGRTGVDGDPGTAVGASAEGLLGHGGTGDGVNGR